ncbi:hypothetical protein [Neobacillus massiliamazoniensis]|jgi:hypothetical protein|uniref:Uncharacterized protein n=1 Tax=Neobacillus massiliamazoniensis TaxID=1499688 RepID=A0A0U1P455_9BACI|nr:hypothetical protein [Neobacillus massiliamazoniensis]CRK84948.1 hypothetical protein BN000_05007 [Neobacillus massiliamazoniensis]
MEKRLKEIQQRLSHEHKDIAKYVKHVFDALDQKAKEHRKLAASNALAGIKLKGDVEKAYYDSIYEMKKLLLDVLEKTVNDMEHKGDKWWEKNFKDGVNE